MNKVVMVFGGSGGLGAVIADDLGANGWDVVVASRSRGELDAASHVEVDVTSESAVRAAIDGVRASRGRLDAVVNAAGITSSAPALETTLTDWERVMATNLTGAFLISRETARVMVADGTAGAILHLASLCSHAGCELVCAYSASKAGLLGLSRSLASEWAQYGIRVNCVVPGVFLTPLNESRLLDTPRGNAARARTPLGRFGRPDELCGAVEYLISDRASFVTGTELVVDGGFLSSGLIQPRAAT